MKKKKKDPVLEFLGRIGRKGGKASAAKRTKDQRQEFAKLGSQARWKEHEYSEKANSVYQRERRKKMKQARETE